jgi:hypothetical protein
LKAVASIGFEHVTKRDRDGFEAVTDVTLEGKSTDLRMLAALEHIT